MKRRHSITGTVFASGAPLADAANPVRRPFLATDRVTWGVCRFQGDWAALVEDEAGLVELSIGLSSPDEAVNCALVALARHWPEGVAGRRDDPRAGEVIAGEMNGRSHPLHLALTPFQEKVLRDTCTIPRGKVRTYGQIAADIGSPGASRAVANALHTNPVALVVPCHRVVPSTGKVGGYACGTALKARILRAEGVDSDATNNLVLPPESSILFSR